MNQVAKDSEISWSQHLAVHRLGTPLLTYVSAKETDGNGSKNRSPADMAMNSFPFLDDFYFSH